MDLAWPFKRHYEIFAGIRDFAEKHADWTFDLGNFPHYELAHGKRYDGIVGRITKDCMTAAMEARIPVVNVWIDSPVADKLAGVYFDSHATGRMAAEHLIARGFRRLAYFGFNGSADAKRQYEGMREVAREHDYPIARYWTYTGFTEKADKWARFVAYIKQVQDGWEAPLGMLLQVDELCHAVSTICRSGGWQIPVQLALMGCGNEPSICNATVPSLSSIDRGDRRIGYEAAHLLNTCMRGGKPPVESLMIPPQEVMVRGSTDCHAVSDMRVARALSHMARQSAAKLSVPVIARFVGVGRQTLERAFQVHLGHSINEELIRLRVANLQRLLVESDKSVKEISARVGFGTTANMFPLFKRLTGITPKQYREKHGPLPGS